MIKKFDLHSTEDSSKVNHLLYYALDWDDNILNMPTVIQLEKKEGDAWVPVEVSTSEFAIVRNDLENYRMPDNNPELAFSNFRDTGPKGDSVFLEDVKKAIEEKRFGPSWNDFIECLSNGSIFSIITARGHESETMRKGVEWIIDNELTEEELYSMYNNVIKFRYLFDLIEDEDFPRILKGKPSQNSIISAYLDSCHFIGVSAPSRGGSPSNPEKAKEDALLLFVDEIDSHIDQLIRITKENWVAIIGFSDDDIKNVKHVEDLIENLHHERFSNIYKIIVKGTKDPLSITKKIRTFNEESSHQAPGLENSVVPFTKWANMTQRLYPNTKDRPTDDYHNQIKNRINLSLDLYKEFAYKRKK